jgi:four helix bundle protein
VQDFRDLKVWQKAHELTLAVYRVTARFPREELYGIVSQLRRAAASVPANLAEGRCRRSDRDFGRFVSIALGSASETEYHLLLARDLGFIQAEPYAGLASQVEEVKRMLSALYDCLMSENPGVGSAG